jgi:hypothetical protein
LEEVRPKLEKEIIEKKIVMLTPVEFHKLREAAAPAIFLRSALREDDLVREVKQEIGNLTPGKPAGPQGGN